jgi:hypothetical protein
MIPPCSRLIPKAACLVLAASFVFSVSAEESDLIRSQSGPWHSAGSWIEDGAATNWVQGRSAIIPAGLNVSVNAQTEVDHLQLDGSVTASDVPLIITGGIAGTGAFAMPNLQTGPGVGTNGVVFATGQPVEVRQNVTLADTTNGRIMVSAIGAGTQVFYNGFWDGWGSNTTHHVRLGAGARFVFGPEARVNNQMRDIVRARAFFANGDGHPDNILEFHPDFNADLGSEGNPQGGLSTLRVGDATLITHATQNLPTIHKLLSWGAPTHHGLLIFDQGSGAHWIVRSQNQEYDGGIFWSRDLTLTTETDLLSIPINAPGEDVGFGSTTPGTTLTKRGAGSLILDHSQGYVMDTTFLIEAGSVVFLSNPFQTWSSGRMVASGNHLSLVLAAGGETSLLPPADTSFHLHQVEASPGATVHLGAGRLQVSGRFALATDSTLRLLLGPGGNTSPKIIAGEVDIQAILQVEAGDGFGPGDFFLFPPDATGALAFSEIRLPSGYAGSFDPATGILAVQTSTGGGYAAWQAGVFPPGAARTGAWEDFSGDGVANIWFYAFDLDPTQVGAFQAAPAAPRMELRGTERVFRLAPAVPPSELDLVVKHSTDLIHWSSLTPTPTGQTVGGHAELGVTLPNSETGFYRVAIMGE